MTFPNIKFVHVIIAEPLPLKDYYDLRFLCDKNSVCFKKYYLFIERLWQLLL